VGYDHTSSLNDRDDACPICGGAQLVAAEGEDFRLDSIEVD
jgi:hypothetical protein